MNILLPIYLGIKESRYLDTYLHRQASTKPITNNLGNKFRALENRRDELTGSERDTYIALRDEYHSVHDLTYWKKRIPDWDGCLECIGEIPTNLVY